MSTKGILAMALGMASMIQAQQEDWKARILKEWENSSNYPRKKKKAVRKSLLLDWSIASWNPMDISNS